MKTIKLYRDIEGSYTTKYKIGLKESRLKGKNKAKVLRALKQKNTIAVYRFAGMLCRLEQGGIEKFI